MSSFRMSGPLHDKNNRERTLSDESHGQHPSTQVISEQPRFNSQLGTRYELGQTAPKLAAKSGVISGRYGDKVAH